MRPQRRTGQSQVTQSAGMHLRPLRLEIKLECSSWHGQRGKQQRERAALDHCTRAAQVAGSADYDAVENAAAL